jgi:hypothetical protein
MVVQTLAPDVLDALLVTWRGAAALLAYGDRLRIYDGPPVTDRAAEIELWVGATGLEAEETVITGTQDWVTLGDATADRDETIEIQNAIWVYSTTGATIGITRRTTFDVFNAAIAAIRGSNLGIAALGPTAAPASWQLHQGEFTKGAGVVITFTIHVDGQL